MSAESNLVFIGVRYPVCEDEIESLELRTHPLISRARAHKLDHYWCNFGGADPLYYFFIGKKLGATGREDQEELAFELENLTAHFQEVSERLEAANINETPQLFVQWMND